jgi:hypothetical protein
MHNALVRARVDLKSGRSTHDRCAFTKEHMLAARMIAKPSDRFILGKPAPHRHIDLAMADTLAYEASMELHAEAAWGETSKVTRVKGRISGR